MPSRSEIVLIGPAASGKTTVGELLAKLLDLPEIAMDELRWRYYAEIGYSSDEADQRQTAAGFKAKYDYWKPFETHALERILQDHADCVFHLGAGHSVYEDDDHLDRASKALRPFDNVVLLLPTPDLDENIRILAARRNSDGESDWAFNSHFVEHHSNYQLAKHTVYTHDRTLEETTQDVIDATRVA